MRALKKAGRLYSLAIGALIVSLGQPVCAQSRMEGENMHQFNEAVFSEKYSKLYLLSATPYEMKIRESAVTTTLPRIDFPDDKSLVYNHLVLPHWEAESLPFFCRIEYDLAKKSNVPLKFRLGSVEYVDWLEGKGDYRIH